MQTKISQWLFPITLFLVPLLFVPFTPNIFSTPKELLLVVIVMLLVLAWGIQTFLSKELVTSASPLRFGLFAFALAIGVNLAFNGEGRIESLIGPASVYLALCAWSYFLTMQHTQAAQQKIVWAILGSTFVLALHNLLQLTFLSRLHILPTYMQTHSFTLTGSPLNTFILLIIGTALSIYLLLKTPHQKLKPIYALSTIIHIISLIALGALLLPGQELALIIFPYSASWNIALDALKSVRSLIIGVGLANFSAFYQGVKPLFLNSTIFWNTTPSSASSELLQILTTMGTLGLLSFLAIPVIALRALTREGANKTFMLLLVLTGLALTLTPGSIPLLLLFFTAVSSLAATTPHTRRLTQPVNLTVFAVVLILLGALGFYTYKTYAAEVHIRNAQIGLSQNDGKKVYQENLAAIELMPTVTSYHLSYSQVNLSLAAALSQKSSLSDNDRQNVTQLVSQAISEGKLATSLRPHDAGTWGNLAVLYRNLINVASGSDQFAISAYTQAIALDPANPGLRLEYGGLLYQLGQAVQKPEDQATLFNQAQNQFQATIQLKPDYANAYYNLSKLLETEKDYNNAYLAMQKAISLLGPTNPDLGKATSELETLKTLLPKPSPSPSASPAPKTSGTTVTTPSPLPSPLPGGEITLPSSN